MKKLLILCSTIGLISAVHASSSGTPPTPPYVSGFDSDSQACNANGGQLLVGIIQNAPWYVSASSSIQGVALSHTHFTVQPLNDTNSGDLYEVAADNVFATGYDNAEPNGAIPDPLSGLQQGQVVEACGLTYNQNPTYSSAVYGIHFVHINDQPITSTTDNGWLKVVNNDGTVSDNLESNTEYLYLWH